MSDGIVQAPATLSAGWCTRQLRDGRRRGVGDGNQRSSIAMAGRASVSRWSRRSTGRSGLLVFNLLSFFRMRGPLASDLPRPPIRIAPKKEEAVEKADR